MEKTKGKKNNKKATQTLYKTDFVQSVTWNYSKYCKSQFQRKQVTHVSRTADLQLAM